MQNKFQVNIIASGSKGNSTIIVADNTAILIDAGISCKRIIQGLRTCGLEPEDLSGVLLTHEHTDHVAGLPVLSRKTRIPIYANERTWAAMPRRGEIMRESIRVLPRNFSLGNITIEPFKISHDAADPVGYSLFCGHDKCTYLTDCGFLDEICRDAVKDAGTLILEANHDVEMLKHGSYPVALQNRILGKKGHLSNATAGELLASLASLPQEVFLAHISHENNSPRLVFNTVSTMLKQTNAQQPVKLYVTRQDIMVSNMDRRTENE
ncbi:MAG: MBL fold metallo-hydrolase [Acidaminococcaceae bacterium]|nr:MBL fold metallo-hydrolase [Acidaminococcaceae bacterium]